MSSIFNLGDQIKLAFSNAMLDLELSDTGRAICKVLDPSRGEIIDDEDEGAEIFEEEAEDRSSERVVVSSVTEIDENGEEYTTMVTYDPSKVSFHFHLDDEDSEDDREDTIEHARAAKRPLKAKAVRKQREASHE